MKSEILTELLKIIAFAVVSLFIAWIMTGIMKRETMCTSLPVNLSVTAVYSALLYMRSGISLTAVQGMLLLSVLLWASWSDMTNHEVGDYIWIMIFMLGLLSIKTVGIRSMLICAAVVFVPQFTLAMINPNKAFGGADIKISTALAFLLGVPRGIVAYLTGLLAVVAFLTIYSKVKHADKKQAFPMVPFLMIGALIFYFGGIWL
jgi:prepilin signal peptidase PulO-like enzyme (type II secretory pathway)